MSLHRKDKRKYTVKLIDHKKIILPVNFKKYFQINNKYFEQSYR